MIFVILWYVWYFAVSFVATLKIYKYGKIGGKTYLVIMLCMMILNAAITIIICYFIFQFTL